jgi:O-acetyl-ADP-ribose deacetylase (regulator of RNase III)
MRFYFIDQEAGVVSALWEAFRPFPEVVVRRGVLLELARNTVVSPANAFGFMDWGIDLVYLRAFGPGIQARVQEAIASRPEGHLPVGASLVVRTDHRRTPFLIVAPTMLTPEAVCSENSFRAMRAILRGAAAHEEIGREVFSPGLGTGVGLVPPAEAAQEMARAYGDWRK